MHRASPTDSKVYSCSKVQSFIQHYVEPKQTPDGAVDGSADGIYDGGGGLTSYGGVENLLPLGPGVLTRNK